MRTSARTIAAGIVLLAAFLLLVIPVAAGAVVTDFTETELCPPNPANPGIWTFPDGNVQVRGMVWQCTDTASDPRLSGSNTIVMNANWDAQMLGPVWGTFHLHNAGGVWDGTWEGMATTGGLRLHGTGTGSAGYEGLKFWLDGASGVYSGHILDPRGQ